MLKSDKTAEERCTPADSVPPFDLDLKKTVQRKANS